MSQTRTHLLAAASALALVVMAPMAAVASAADPAPADQKIQDTGPVLEEVVVTAQHRSENLQNVPIAVTAVTGATLEKRGVTDTESLEMTVPSLTYSTLAGAASPRIRGVGTTVAGSGNENAVATYVDGVYYASPSASILSFNSVSQIAVLKGPQGTLFGRNATGGLIQITTRDPSHQFQGEADLTVGNLGSYGGNLYITGELAEPIAADLAIHYDDQTKGFGENRFNGTSVNESRNISVRSKVRADLGPDTNATVTVDYANNRSATPAYRPITPDLGIGDYAQATGPAFVGDKWDVASNINPLVRVEQWGGALTINHQLGFAKLVSITAYRQSLFNANLDGDATSLDLLNVYSRDVDKQFSQEVRLESTTPGNLTWQIGAYYFHGSGGFEPALIGAPAFGLNQRIDTHQTADSVAAFGQGTWRFDEATSLTVGLRYTTEKKSIDGGGSLYFPATNFTLVQGPYSDSSRVNKPTWRIVLDHKLAQGTLVYVSYNRGFKSGGFDPGSIAAAAPFKPEVLDAYEVGLKTELLDHRVRFNSAAFHYDYKDIQLNQFSNGLLSIYNGKSAKISGLDLDVTAAVTSDFTLNGGLSLVKSRFGDFPITYTAPIPGGGVNPLPLASADGQRLPNTPAYQINLGADYVVRLATGNIDFNVTAFRSGRWYAQPENRLYQKPYNLVNAQAAWTIDADEKYRLTVWGKNLGNKAYASQLVTQIPVADFVTLAPGRTFGATFRAAF